MQPTRLVPLFLATALSACVSVKFVERPSLPADAPLWVHAVRGAAVLPSVGLSNVRLGATEPQIVAVLGSPSSSSPTYDLRGNFVHYALLYRYRNAFIGLYLDQSKRLQSMRISDADFGADGYLPTTAAGLSVGSSDHAVYSALGAPVRQDRHSTCPQQIGREASSVFYPGVSLAVCHSNRRVYWIDIP